MSHEAPEQATAVSMPHRFGSGAILRLSVAVAAVFGLMGTAILVPAGSAGAADGNQTFTFGYTGSPQTFTVPLGVTSIDVTLFGAQGAGAQGGGLGGEATDTLSVTPGTVYQVNVGGQNGYNGGGGGGSGSNGSGGNGGGASDLRTGSFGLSDRVIVAGGGGGSGGNGNSYQGAGGAGGGTAGDGGENMIVGAPYGYEWYGGNLGNQSGGGNGGSGGPSGQAGNSGVLGQGGSAGSISGGGFGGGGGGGGFYGGGGGQSATTSYGPYNVPGGPGGGGGSGYGPGGSTLTTGVQSGNGQVTISYSGPLVPSIALTPSAVDVTPGITETYTVAISTPSGSPTPLGNGGTVSLTDNGVALSGCTDVTPSRNQVSCQQPIGTGQMGTNSIIASYSGDSTYEPVSTNPTAVTGYWDSTAFTYTGGPQSFTVPPGVTSVGATLMGAQGGSGSCFIGGGSSGGLGGEDTGSFSTVPGTTYQVLVGGQQGYDDGGTPSADSAGCANGGGATILSPDGAVGDSVAVAGGGGGGAGAPGGAGGGAIGGDGNWANGSGPGGGGTQTAGGAGGSNNGGGDGSPGSLGQGGQAGAMTTGLDGAGGGGGGYYGGGGGGGTSFYDAAGSGGGGSSYGPGFTLLQGIGQGNGWATLYYDGAQTSTTVALTVPAPAVTAGTATTLTATLTGASGGIPIDLATGTVAFDNGGVAPHRLWRSSRQRRHRRVRLPLRHDRDVFDHREVHGRHLLHRLRQLRLT